ncbi:hypothetical protein [Agrobacterium tumefaciens]|jgi:hypothetical protein|uniref:hypothetical protein n=1 Tax=Agrobacterium tumefaciens TaxID=358 RepID=UPI001572F53F|nr:hypothetical protein [Agrobacterium tumefaciens]NTD85427.1 hypothetical protein [Agrobacterium tumefaciens]NTD90776.1 hypothetical protein [Agrobacterium tumefaciens]NTE15850.1 hypothetical protein [Agrobacterium tumefaciens]NTE30474.1 hypothetical protein [Agrobacterium tumefaciens]NTE42667.1 hypothetical protein [Agrobacterium tumefaciens]
MITTRAKDAPLTVERVEQALDKLAEIIVFLGDDGVNLLPIFERVEADLETMKASTDRLASVRERLKRSKDRKEGRPS